MYIITARRMTSGELLKYRKGLFITADYETLLSGSSRFSLTKPSTGVAPHSRLALNHTIRVPNEAALATATARLIARQRHYAASSESVALYDARHTNG